MLAVAAPYQSPYTLRPAHVSQVARIAEQLGQAEALEHGNLDPALRRQNRIRSIQASLEMENNSLGIEFIHPFSDGNGRIGRLWQTLILSRWKPTLAYLPVETVIRDRQQKYYDALSASDSLSDAAPFVEFILIALEHSLDDSQTTDQVIDQVKRLLFALAVSPQEPQSAESLMETLGLKHRPTFRTNYLNPALEAGLIERTDPGSPRSPAQKYRLARRDY